MLGSARILPVTQEFSRAIYIPRRSERGGQYLNHPCIRRNGISLITDANLNCRQSAAIQPGHCVSREREKGREGIGKSRCTTLFSNRRERLKKTEREEAGSIKREEAFSLWKYTGHTTGQAGRQAGQLGKGLSGVKARTTYLVLQRCRLDGSMDIQHDRNRSTWRGGRELASNYFVNRSYEVLNSNQTWSGSAL